MFLKEHWFAPSILVLREANRTDAWYIFERLSTKEAYKNLMAHLWNSSQAAGIPTVGSSLWNSAVPRENAGAFFRCGPRRRWSQGRTTQKAKPSANKDWNKVFLTGRMSLANEFNSPQSQSLSFLHRASSLLWTDWLISHCFLNVFFFFQ